MSALSDFLTQQTAPWWGVPLGVLGGAGIAFFSASRSDRRKAINDKLSHDDDLVREVCTDYIKSLSDLYYLVAPRNAQAALPTQDEIRQAKSEAYQASTVTQLLVDEEVIRAGKTFYVSTADYVDSVVTDGLKDPRSLELHSKYRASRSAYINAVRVQLGQNPVTRT